ncbi:hypothetical protein [Microbaculum marinum]|uniref:Uncharacterized protein n=1 Tax=Microbaculum marinum TaxID=1764581 RepID=A0AAW9RV81_9HYPH
MRFACIGGRALFFGLATLALAGIDAQPARADNQTPTVSEVSTDAAGLPYSIELRAVDSSQVLPTLQSFAFGQTHGLWVILGGRTNGLHGFSNSGLKNFPPRRQNRRIWVIDPVSGERWSRKLSDSSLTQDQIDALSSTATEKMQIGDTLYVIGGYGYSQTQENFVTFDTLTALDLLQTVAWVRREPVFGIEVKDLADIIRQTSRGVLKVTGGQVTQIGSRTVLAFGQLFDGGYGDPDANQVYTTQLRSFKLRDNGRKVAIRKVRRDPKKPNPTDYRRRDYTLVPFLQMKRGKTIEKAAALAGVFTLTDGIFTVPVEFGEEASPQMANPDASRTFKQAMNGYDCAYLAIWDRRTKSSHSVLFGGISYVYYDSETGEFVEDTNFPFINDITSVVRDRKGRYEQVLVGEFPTIMSTDGKELLFGAEAEMFIDPATPTTSNGMVDLAALRRMHGNEPVVVGRIFGGIAADAPNFGNSVASNIIFEVVLTPQ